MSRREQVVYLAAAWCLTYPDEELIGRVPLMRAALAEFPGAVADFAEVLQRLESTPPLELQAPTSVSSIWASAMALHLSYWTDGDTRRRGEVLGNFKKTYRQSDILVDTHGELPDYLPMVLEYAALVDLAAGRELLSRFRASLEMLRFGLLRDELPHARILQAICATLPGKSPSDEQAVMRMAGYGPPTEAVGLDPYEIPRCCP